MACRVRERDIDKIRNGILLGEDVERDGYFIVNHIGATTYISFDHLTKKELKEIASLKNLFENKGGC